MTYLSEQFNTIKKKHQVLAIVKSVVCALSLGLAVTGILLLALKLSGVNLAVGYYVLIGVGVALIGGVTLFFLLFRPTDKQVAKSTDEDYQLNERVQTALAYSDRSGTVVELQREDAEERINNLPKRKFSFARIWQLCVVVVLALAIGVAGILVPANASNDDGFVDDDNTPRQVTELERVGVRELVSNIEASALADELKTNVVAILNKLLVDLDSVNTEGTLKHAVNTAISDTEEVLTSTLSYVQLGSALTNADQGYLGQAVTNGGGVYRYYMLTEYDEVRTFDYAKYDASNVKVVNAVTALRNNLTLPISEGLVELLARTSLGVSTALADSGSEQDGLYVALQSYADGLWEIKSKAEDGLDDVGVQNEITELNSNFVVSLTNNVSTQAYNAAISVFVSNRLKIIFGYSPLQLPIVDTDRDGSTSTPGNDEGKEPSESDQSSGGGGSGEMEYGSDDMIWVPGRGYMKYGDVIDEYYSLINQYLHSDELTDEQKNMIRAYYDILFGSNKGK